MIGQQNFTSRNPKATVCSKGIYLLRVLIVVYMEQSRYFFSNAGIFSPSIINIETCLNKIYNNHIKFINADKYKQVVGKLNFKLVCTH